jgi:hypothetical protein
MTKFVKILSVTCAFLGFAFMLGGIFSGLNFPNYWSALTIANSSTEKYSQGVLICFFLSLFLYLFSEYFDDFTE